MLNTLCCSLLSRGLAITNGCDECVPGKEHADTQYEVHAPGHVILQEHITPQVRVPNHVRCSDAENCRKHLEASYNPPRTLSVGGVIELMLRAEPLHHYVSFIKILCITT